MESSLPTSFLNWTADRIKGEKRLSQDAKCPLPSPLASSHISLLGGKSPCSTLVLLLTSGCKKRSRELLLSFRRPWISVGQSAQVLQSHGDTGSWCHPVESGCPAHFPSSAVSSVSSFCTGYTAAKTREPMETQVLATSADELWRREPVSELYVHFWEERTAFYLLLRSGHLGFFL